jgi:ornithine carbamoyltransferase
VHDLPDRTRSGVATEHAKGTIVIDIRGGNIRSPRSIGLDRAANRPRTIKAVIIATFGD